MLLKPGESQNHILLSQVGDSERSPLGVIIVAQDQIHDFGDRASLISSSIHIEHRNRAGEFARGESVTVDEVGINELTCSSTVDQRGRGEHFTRVSGLNRDLERQRL